MINDVLHSKLLTIIALATEYSHTLICLKKYCNYLHLKKVTFVESYATKTLHKYF